MDIGNKHINYNPRKLDDKILNLFHKKKDGLAIPRKEDLSKKLAKMKTMSLKSIHETDWMFHGQVPIQFNFGKLPDFKSDAIKFS